MQRGLKVNGSSSKFMYSLSSSQCKEDWKSWPGCRLVPWGPLPVSMQRGLKVAPKLPFNDISVIVSMQRGLKDWDVPRHLDQDYLGLNAKRIESSCECGSGNNIQLCLNAKRIERRYMQDVRRNSGVQSQCKEDWKGSSTWSSTLSMRSMSQCKEDWKLYTIFLSLDLSASRLNAKRIERTGKCWIRQSSFTVSMQRGLKVYLSSLALSLASPVSMQRGLKVGWSRYFQKT